MSETAQHRTVAKDSTVELIESLATLDVKGLSFVQLKRLHKVLEHACDAVANESAARAENEEAGDTVRVPAAEA